MRATATAIQTTDEIRTSLQRAIALKDHELTSLRNALAWLDAPAPAAATEEEAPKRQAKPKPGRGTTQQRSPKKSKKSPATTRRAPADDAETAIPEPKSWAKETADKRKKAARK